MYKEINPSPSDSTVDIHKLASRCLQNPGLADDPKAVIINERDKLLDELKRMPIKRPPQRPPFNPLPDSGRGR